MIAQLCPYMGQCFQILVDVFGSDGDEVASFQTFDARQEGEAELAGMYIDQDEYFVVGAGLDGLAQIFAQMTADNNLLFAHKYQCLAANLRKNA